jgi:4-oxalocrotonate tautomerase family enzyme
MPVVIVEMLDAQDMEQKKQLVKDLTHAFVKIGVPAESVNVILRENPKSCWAIAGKICSDFEVPQGA